MKRTYSCYYFGKQIGLAEDAFTLWLAGKVLVQDNLNTRIIAWFADMKDAKEFCEYLDEKESKLRKAEEDQK